MAKKKPKYDLSNVVDSSQVEQINDPDALSRLLDGAVNILNTPFGGTLAPTKKEIEIARSGEGDIRSIPLKDLVTYHNHTYKVLDNEDMDILVDSIRDYGILLPIIVRELNGGKYEIISGHRRRFAAEKLGLSEVPCRVLDLDDDMEDIVMADTNIARETILPSEKARTYKVRLEAAVRQGKRQADELKAIAEESSDSDSNVRRYLKLNDLSPALLDKVDEGKLPVTAGVILADLSASHQEVITDIVADKEIAISLKEAEKLKKAAARGLTRETAESILAGKLNPRTKKKKAKKESVTEAMFLDAVPEEVKELPTEERAEYYKAAIRAFAEANV